MTLNLLFVGDGPRDEAAVPRLVERLLGICVSGEFEAWKNLHLRGSGRGLGKKLLYMLIRARDRGADGVVATVDADRFDKNDKLADLKAAREKDRAAGNATPAAIGEAIPHLEAWLLDDDVAVRTALSLPSNTPIEAPTKVKSPNDELNRLHGSSGVNKTVVEVLAAIAAEVSAERCGRAEHTGFNGFRQEVENEFGPACK